MLRILVFYDISDDRKRNKICDTCLDYGLDRQQYSVFIGQLKSRQVRALSKELCRMAENEGYVIILPVSADDWDKRIELGSPLHVA